MSEGDIYKFAIRGLLASQPIVNTLGFAQISLTAGDTRPTLVSEWKTNSKANYLAAFGDQFTLQGYDVTEVVPSSLALYSEADSGTGTGSVGNDSPPTNCALVVTFRTPIKGRSFRGRNYFAAGVEANISLDIYNSGTTGAVNTYVAGLMTRFGPTGTSANFRWGVISYVNNGVKRNPPIFTGITSYTVHNDVRSIRRRAFNTRISRA